MKLHSCALLFVICIVVVYGQRQLSSNNDPEKLGISQSKIHSSRGKTRFTQTQEYQESVPNTRPISKPSKVNRNPTRSETRIVENVTTRPIVYATSRRGQENRRTLYVTSTLKTPEKNYEVEEIFDDIPRQTKDQYHYSRESAEIAAQNEALLSAQRVHQQSHSRKQNYQETIDNVLQSTKTNPTTFHSRQSKPKVTNENRFKTRVNVPSTKSRNANINKPEPKIDQSYSRVTEVAQTTKPDTESRVIEVTENEPDITYAEFLLGNRSKQKTVTKRPTATVDESGLHYRTGRRIQSIIEPREVRVSQRSSSRYSSEATTASSNESTMPDLRTPKGRGNKKANFENIDRKRSKSLDTDSVNIATTRGRGRLAITDLPQYLSYMKRVEPIPPKPQSQRRVDVENETYFLQSKQFDDETNTQDVRSGSIILPLVNMELQKTDTRSLETAASRRSETKVPAASASISETTYTVRSRNIRSTTEKQSESRSDVSRSDVSRSDVTRSDVPRSDIPRRGRTRTNTRSNDETTTKVAAREVSRGSSRRNNDEKRSTGRGESSRTGRRNSEKIEQSTAFPSRGSRRPTKTSQDTNITPRSASRRSSKSYDTDESSVLNNYPDKMPSNMRSRNEGVLSSTESLQTSTVSTTSSTATTLNSSKTEQVTAVDRSYPSDNKVIPTKSLESMDQESSEKVMNIITAQTPTIRGRRPTTTATTASIDNSRPTRRSNSRRGESKVSASESPKSLRRGTVKTSTTVDSPNIKRETSSNRGRGSVKLNLKKTNIEDVEESDNYPEPFKALLKKKQLADEHIDGSRSNIASLLSTSRTKDDHLQSTTRGTEKVTLITTKASSSSTTIASITSTTTSTTTHTPTSSTIKSSSSRVKLNPSSSGNRYRGRVLPKTVSSTTIKTSEHIPNDISDDFTIIEKSTTRSRTDLNTRTRRPIANRFVKSTNTEKPIIEKQYNTVQRSKPLRTTKFTSERNQLASSTSNDFDNNVIPSNQVVDASTKYTTPIFNNIRQISPTPESENPLEETTISQNSQKKTRNFIPKPKGFHPSTSKQVLTSSVTDDSSSSTSGYKKKSQAFKNTRNSYTTQVPQFVVKPSEHKFSARYRSDLLRGNNFRITSTPSYTPTIPVINTHRNAKYDINLNDSENDLEILTVIPSRVPPKLYSANLVLDEAINDSTTTTEKVTIITPESTSNIATLLTVTTTESPINTEKQSIEKLTTITPKFTTSQIITTQKILTTRPTITTTSLAPKTTTPVRTTTPARTTTTVQTTTPIRTTTPARTTTPTILTTRPTVIPTIPSPITTTTERVIQKTERTQQVFKFPITTPKVVKKSEGKEQALKVTTTTQTPTIVTPTTTRQFNPTYTTTVKTFITEKIYTAESAPPNFLSSLLSNYINNPTVTTKFPETTRSYSTVSVLASTTHSSTTEFASSTVKDDDKAQLLTTTTMATSIKSKVLNRSNIPDKLVVNLATTPTPDLTSTVAPTSIISALTSILGNNFPKSTIPSISNLSLLPLMSTPITTTKSVTQAQFSLDTAFSESSSTTIPFKNTTSTTTLSPSTSTLIPSTTSLPVSTTTTLSPSTSSLIPSTSSSPVSITTPSTTTAKSTTIPPSTTTTRAHTVFPTAWAPPGYVPRFATRPSIALLGTLSSSTSSTTTTPKNDYFVFGILPNNTVVRKKPRNLQATTSSSFIVFGIFPNNTIVRKYPNGTIVPDDSSDVEITNLSAKNLKYSLQNGINITTPSVVTTANLITTPSTTTTIAVNTQALLQEDNIQDNLIDTVRKISPSSFLNPDASASTHILSLTTTKSPKTTESLSMSTTVIPPFIPLEPKLPTLAEILGPKVVEAYKGIVNETRGNRTTNDNETPVSVFDINRMEQESFKEMKADRITTIRPVTVNWKPIQGVPFTAVPASEFYDSSSLAPVTKSKTMEFIESNRPQSFTSSTTLSSTTNSQTTEPFLTSVRKSENNASKITTTTVPQTTARPTRMRHKTTTVTPTTTTEKPKPSTRRPTTTQRRPAKLPVTTTKAVITTVSPTTVKSSPSRSPTKLSVKEQSLVDELAFLNSLREASSVITQQPKKDQEELANRIIALAIGNQNKPITTSTSTKRPQEPSIFNLLETPNLSTSTSRTPKKLKTNNDKITADEIKTFQEDLQFLKLLQDSGLAGTLGAGTLGGGTLGAVTKSPIVSTTYGKSNEALLAALLKEQGIGPSVSKNTNQLLQELQLSALLDQIAVSPKPKPRPTKRRPITTTTQRPIFGLFQGVRNWLVGAFVGPESQSQQQSGRRPALAAVAIRPRPRPTTTTEDPFDNDLSFAFIPEKASASTVKKPSLQSGASPNIFSDEFDEDSTVLKERPRAINTNTKLEEIPLTEKPRPRTTTKPRRKTTTTVSPFDEEEIIDGEAPQQVRGQLVDAAINVTKAFSQFLGAAIQGAANTFQSFLNSGTRNFGTYLSSGSIG